MADQPSFFRRHVRELRRAVQLGTLGFIVLIPVLNREGYFFLRGTFYSLDIGSLTITDPALILQSALLTQILPLSLLIAGIIPVILAFILGRVFCSWVCPYNFFAELLYKLRGKLSAVQPGKNQNPKQRYYWTIFMVILALAAITSIPLITLFSMPGQISGQITDLITFGTYGIEVLMILMILGLDTLVFKRQWCKFVCPVGAALAFFHRGKSFRITAEATRCKHCDQRENHPCNVVCPLQLNPRRDDIYPYCYNCFDCVQVCARNGQALSIAYDKK